MADSYRSFNTGYWEDDYVINKDPMVKLVFAYVFTNKSVNWCGIYKLSLKKMSMEIGLDDETIVNILRKLEEDRRCKFFNGWMGIRNFTKQQKYNGNLLKAFVNDLKDILRKGVPQEIVEWVANENDHFRDVLRASKALETLRGLSGYFHSYSYFDKYSYSNSDFHYQIEYHSDSNSYNDSTCASDDRSPDDVFLEIAHQLYQDIQELVCPPLFINHKPDVGEWARDIELIHQIDGVSIDDIKLVAAWAVRDSFWQANILTGKKLREKFNTLHLQMNRSKNSAHAKQRLTDPEERRRQLRELSARRVNEESL